MTPRSGWVLALVALGACGPYGMQARTVAASVQRPANVAAYLEVTDDGAPVTGLAATAFSVYEDGQLLDPQQIGLALLPGEQVASRRTLLLVDVTGDQAARPALAKAVLAFVQGAGQPVGVYAFDGSAALRRVEPGQLASLAPTDPSRDLRGAVTRGLARLDDALAGDGKPVRVGTLVVFTSGPDAAGRVTRHDLDAALDRSPHQVVAIGVGKSASADLDDLGRSGTFEAPSPAALDDAFHQAAERVAALAAGQYVVAYCSPARGGVHDVRVAVGVAGGHTTRTAEATLRFSAAGFSAGCASHTTPRFVVTLVGAGDTLAAGVTPEGAVAAAPPAAHARHPGPPRATPAPAAAPAKPKPKSSEDFEP